MTNRDDTVVSTGLLTRSAANDLTDPDQPLTLTVLPGRPACS